MKTLRFSPAAFIISAAAVFTEVRWGVSPLTRMPLGPGLTSYAAFIKREFPIHIISPDRFHVPDNEILGRWMKAEIEIRSIVILLVWYIGLILVFRWATSANQVPEDTARKLADPQH